MTLVDTYRTYRIYRMPMKVPAEYEVHDLKNVKVELGKLMSVWAATGAIDDMLDGVGK